MSFEQALRQNPPPAGQVGDITLRYEPPVLIGETRLPPERALRAGGLLMAAAALVGAGCLATLLAEGPVPLALTFAAVAGGLFFAGARADGRIRGRRRFVLHFGTETLRLDGPSGGNRARTRTIPFDDVVDLYVLAGDDGECQLLVEVRHAPGKKPTATLLVDEVPPEAREDLQRLWGTLRAAFGLRPPPKAG